MSRLGQRRWGINGRLALTVLHIHILLSFEELDYMNKCYIQRVYAAEMYRQTKILLLRDIFAEYSEFSIPIGSSTRGFRRIPHYEQHGRDHILGNCDDVSWLANRYPRNRHVIRFSSWESSRTVNILSRYHKRVDPSKSARFALAVLHIRVWSSFEEIGYVAQCYTQNRNIATEPTVEMIWGDYSFSSAS